MRRFFIPHFCRGKQLSRSNRSSRIKKCDSFFTSSVYRRKKDDESDLIAENYIDMVKIIKFFLFRFEKRIFASKLEIMIKIVMCNLTDINL